MKTTKEKVIAIVLIITTLGFFTLLGNFFGGCDYFQKKTYTDSDDRIGRYYEVCLKGQHAENKAAGSNLRNCDNFIDALTPQGKLNTFKDCLDYKLINKSKLKKAELNFECYDLIYGKRNKKN